MTGNFTFEYYRFLIGLLQNKDYLFSSFDRDCTIKRVILRHDIDIDIYNSLNMAEIESQLGAFSTWFIQPNNDFYNMLSKQIVEIISEIHHLGGIIGLHIDGTMFSDQDEMIINIKKMFDFYQEYLPLDPVFSFHRPAKFLENPAIEIDGLINAYETPFFKEMAYISDSNRRKFWEEERLFNAIENGSSIQLLTHPLWWREKDTSKEIIQKQVRDMAVEKIADNALRNVPTGNFQKESH